MELQTKNGDWFTDYGLACGYCNHFENSKDSLSLYKEHTVYHVRSKGVWNSFEKLSDARKEYTRIYKQLTK